MIDKFGKSLVVYFSRGAETYGVGTVEVGNTELVAKEIIARTGADEFKIIPVEKYPEGYEECVERATEERDEEARPEYVGRVEDFSEYKTVFLGYPIWWGDMPMIIYKFIEDYDFNGKRVVPFCTNEGSGNAGTFRTLATELSEAGVLEGLEMTGREARTEEMKEKVREWLEGLGP